MVKRLSAEERRASIVDAATQVFSQVGYQRGTMVEVARRVGVSEPVVFQNFGSKAAVFAAVVEHAARRMSAVLRERAAAHPTVGAWLQELLGAEHMRRVHTGGMPGVVFADAMSLMAEPGIRDSARRAHRTIARTLADLLAQGQQDGSVRRELDAEVTAWWILSLFASQGFRAATMPNRDRLEGELGAMSLRLLLPAGEPAAV